MSLTDVVILTEGGKDIGFGHITRCLSLCQGFEERGIQSKFIVHGDSGVLDFLSPSPNPSHQGMGISRERNISLPLVGRVKIWNWFQDQPSLHKAIDGAGIAIVDSYLAGQDIYEEISRRVKTVLCVDDYRRLTYPPGIVLSVCPDAENMGYPSRPGVSYLLGARYIPLRKEFWDAPPKVCSAEITNVLIILGGNDIRNLTPRALDFWVKNYPQLNKTVVVGKKTALFQIQDKKIQFIDSVGAAMMNQLMLNSDTAISAGGQTIYELARMGAPTIGICVADNQIPNLQAGEREGFLHYAGNYRDNDLETKWAAAMQALDSQSVRQRMAEAGQRLVDGQGSRRVAQAVLAGFFKKDLRLRRAAFADARNLFELANTPAIRENSFNPNPIRWEDHVQWLQQKLNDKNTIFFIISVKDEFGGQIRFDIDSTGKEGSAVINIGLHPSIRGLGLSAFLMDQAIDELQKICQIRIVKAYIREHNTASIKSFTKAKFIFAQDVMMNHFPTKLYLRRIG